MLELVILICLEELMLTKPVVSASVLFVITSTFLRSNLDFSQCNGCHHLMQKDKNAKTKRDFDCEHIYIKKFWKQK